MKHVCIELTHLREEKRAARDLVQSMDAVQRPVVVAPAQRPGRLELTYPREDPRAARREVVAVERRARGLVHAEHIIVLEDDERIGDDDGVGVGVVDDARRRRGRRARGCDRGDDARGATARREARRAPRPRERPCADRDDDVTESADESFRFRSGKVVDVAYVYCTVV